MASFETASSETIVLVGFEPSAEPQEVERSTGQQVRRLVLRTYPAGYHASRAAHPSQRHHRN